MNCTSEVGTCMYPMTGEDCLNFHCLSPKVRCPPKGKHSAKVYIAYTSAQMLGIIAWIHSDVISSTA